MASKRKQASLGGSGSDYATHDSEREHSEEIYMHRTLSPAPKRRRSSVIHQLMKDPQQNDALSPSAPGRYLTDELPIETRKILQRLYSWEHFEARSRCQNFTIGSLQNVYRRNDGDLWNPNGTIAQYTDPSNELLEVKPYLLQDIVESFEAPADRWILVAKNDKNGPWIIKSKGTDPDACLYQIWRGQDGFESGASVQKTWTIAPSRPDESRATLSSYQSSPGGRSLLEKEYDKGHQYPAKDHAPRWLREIPANLVKDLQSHILKHNRRREETIASLTTTHNRFTIRKNGHLATFEACSDGSTLDAYSISTGDVKFLTLNGRQRRLNFVVDSSKRGYLVKCDGRPHDGKVTYYQKWYPDRGFEKEPSVRKLGKAMSQESRPTDSPSKHSERSSGGIMRTPSITCVEPEARVRVDHGQTHASPNNNDRQHTDLGGADTYKTDINAMQDEKQQPGNVDDVSSNITIKHDMTRFSNDAEPQFMRIDGPTKSRSMHAGSERPQSQRHSVLSYEPPEVVFRFIRSSTGESPVEYVDVDAKKCNLLKGFKMELAKSGMCPEDVAESGDFHLKIYIEGSASATFLMNGADPSVYGDLLSRIKDARERTESTGRINVCVRHWN
ncbi:MAG: hypothetical protein Q9160_005598 [Pyrenula sp. 1 TL-2023]